jgi:hypothetical protein
MPSIWISGPLAQNGFNATLSQNPRYFHTLDDVHLLSSYQLENIPHINGPPHKFISSGF